MATLPDILQSTTWQAVNLGLSGASLFHGEFAARKCFLKITPKNHRFPVSAEYERIQWLKGRLPVAEVLHYLEDDSRQYLVTAKIDGIALFDFVREPDERIKLYARALRQLHDLPIGDCPFTWTVDEQIAYARRVVEKDDLQREFLDAEFADRPAQELFDELVSCAPETSDPVIVHGDAYNDNILVHPQTGDLAAYIDVGNLSIADRYTDLAMAYDDVIDGFGEDGWRQFLQCYGLDAVDEQKLRFYQLFNEFL